MFITTENNEIILAKQIISYKTASRWQLRVGIRVENVEVLNHEDLYYMLSMPKTKQYELPVSPAFVSKKHSLPFVSIKKIISICGASPSWRSGEKTLDEPPQPISSGEH